MSLSNTKSARKGAPRIFKRQRKLLKLLDAIGGGVNNRDFQKLLFLYCQEPEAADVYEFVPYRFGAFSFTSYTDRRKLIGLDLLVDDEQNWELTEKGREVVGPEQELHLSAFTRRHRNLRGDALVAETYRLFPYYATRSEIVTRVLGNDSKALKRIESARPQQATTLMFTIGYEGRTIECYLNELLKAGATLLCDVRKNPISRKYGFSKSALSKSCNGVGIRYEHLPELGIASNQRRNLKTQADYDLLFSEYERETLPHQSLALAKIQEKVQAGEHAALTCYERSPDQCHRKCVAEAIEREFGKNFTAKHL